MKNIISLVFCSFLLATASSCIGGKSTGEGACRIHGTISTKYNDVQVFLVPTVGPQDAAHVDSVHIKDGKFEFTKDTVGVYDLRLDYHYRYGIQQLIVVTEPGDVNVVLGDKSEATGTPQNDSLNVWKGFMEQTSRDFNALKQRLQANSALTDQQRDDSIRAYQNYFRTTATNFAQRQPEGVLREAMLKMYPAK